MEMNKLFKNCSVDCRGKAREIESRIMSSMKNVRKNLRRNMSVLILRSRKPIGKQRDCLYIDFDDGRVDILCLKMKKSISHISGEWINTLKN